MANSSPWNPRFEEMRQWVLQRYFPSLITSAHSPAQSPARSSAQTSARSSARTSAQSPARSSARSSAQTSARSPAKSSTATIKFEAAAGGRRGYRHSNVKLESNVSVASSDEDSDTTVKLESSRKKNSAVTHKKEVKGFLTSDQKKRRNQRNASMKGLNPGKVTAKRTGISVVKPRRKSSYDQYYTALLRTAKKYRRFNNTVSSRSMVVMNDLMKDIFDRVALETRSLMAASRKKVMNARDIQFAVKMVFPRYLADRAICKANKALQKYYESYNK